MSNQPPPPPQSMSDQLSPPPPPQSTSSPPPPPTDPNQQPFQPVRLKLLSPVATWSWVLDGDQCSICRNSLMAVCVRCQALTSNKNTTCSVSWGKCSHAYHKHCIDVWITNSRNVCPIDEVPWFEQQNAQIIA